LVVGSVIALFCFHFDALIAHLKLYYQIESPLQSSYAIVSIVHRPLSESALSFHQCNNKPHIIHYLTFSIIL
jgi:hypothetical protein